METFYSPQELEELGLASFGDNVLISRNAVIYRPDLLTVGHDVRIDDFCVISGKVTLGNYIHLSHFGGYYGGTAGITIGDYCGFSSKVSVYATSNDYSGEWMNNPTVPAKFHGDTDSPVSFGKHGLIGCGTVILPGVSVGEGCSIGSMTLCSKSLEPWGIYAGIPARRIKERSRRVLELEHQMMEESSLSLSRERERERRADRKAIILVIFMGDVYPRKDPDRIHLRDWPPGASVRGTPDRRRDRARERCAARRRVRDDAAGGTQK